MTISAIFFLDSKGKPLLSRNYKGDIPITSAIEEFPKILVSAQQESTSIPPCINKNGINYIFITHNDIFILGLSKQNSNASAVLYFFHQLLETLTQYLNNLDEETIRDNFVIIYELLDEMMDFGHPQISDYKVLQEYITQDSHPASASASSIVTNAVSWRPDGIFYKKNELFLDVIESVEFLLGADGKIIHNNVLGKVSVNAYLSGMPNLKLGLNDVDKKILQQQARERETGEVEPTKPKKRIGSKQVHLEDVKFHQCVELDQFEADRTITFTPPDGKFDLLTYRVSNLASRPLFLVDATVAVKSRSRAIVNVTVKSQFRKRSTASFVEISIPVPPDADSPKFKTTAGTVVYAPEKNAIVWKLKDFPGGVEYKMKTQIQLSSLTGQMDDEEFYNENTNGVSSGAASVDSAVAFKTATINRIKTQPISVKFEIPYFAVSGLQVRYLKVEEPRLKYQSLPWVRYLTQSGEYQIRLPPQNVF